MPRAFACVCRSSSDKTTPPVHLRTKVVRLTDSVRARTLVGETGVEIAERRDGATLALFPDKWRLEAILRRYADNMLAPLVADAT